MRRNSSPDYPPADHIFGQGVVNMEGRSVPGMDHSTIMVIFLAIKCICPINQMRLIKVQFWSFFLCTNPPLALTFNPPSHINFFCPPSLIPCLPFLGHIAIHQECIPSLCHGKKQWSQSETMCATCVETIKVICWYFLT